jgi:hypothetical protein
MKSSRLVCRHIRAGCRLYPTWSRFSLAGEISWCMTVFVTPLPTSLVSTGSF